LSTLLRLIFLVPLGYVAACIAAALMMAFTLFGYQSDDPAFVIPFTASVFILLFWTGAVAFAPAVLAIVLAEIFAWRSVLYYLLVGGAIALLADQVAETHGRFEFADQRIAIFLAAGFVGGFAYWLIAGQGAGVKPDA
jgi:drug/metabolite transporter (DMT)-like permease